MNKKSPAYVLSFMAVICLVFGTGISIVNYATQGLLQRNEAKHRNRILSRAFDLPVDGTSAEAYQQAVTAHLAASEIDGRAVYRRTTPGHESIGFDFAGMGFWGPIEGLIVLTPDLRQVVNIQFYEHQETPGLGARIEETWFTDQFKGLRVDWDHPRGDRIVVGASPDPDPQNRVDAITGATQTSMALGRFLNDELARIRELKLEQHETAKDYDQD